MVSDLESLPWPWPDNSVDEVIFKHSLEHLGQDPRTFLGMMKELYRVCRNGAEITVTVPHPRHDDFIGDPTHVRIITPEMLALFDRKQCDTWQRMGASNTPLAHYLHVDFAVVTSEWVLAEPDRTPPLQARWGSFTMRPIEYDRCPSADTVCAALSVQVPDSFAEKTRHLCPSKVIVQFAQGRPVSWIPLTSTSRAKSCAARFFLPPAGRSTTFFAINVDSVSLRSCTNGISINSRPGSTTASTCASIRIMWMRDHVPTRRCLTGCSRSAPWSYGILITGVATDCSAV